MSIRRELSWLALALVVLLAWDSSTLDHRIVHWYFDADGFRWRNHWFTSGLMHNGGRWLCYCVFGSMIVSLFHRMPWNLDQPRSLRLWTVFTVLLCMLVITCMKRYSLTSCPWSLAEFGGVAQAVSHWRWGVPDGGEGHCFPSGHASSAFALLPGAFALLANGQPRAARWWLAVVLVAGALFGWSQMMRGAHYASHTLWTGWICWALTALSFRLHAARQQDV